MDDPIKDVEAANIQAHEELTRRENDEDAVDDEHIVGEPTSAQEAEIEGMKEAIGMTALARMAYLMSAYTPNPDSAAETYHVWHSIADAIADGHKHETYLTLKQLANAIVIGLSHWGHAGTDAKVLAKEIEFLSNE